MPVYKTTSRGKVRVPHTNRERVRAWRHKQSQKGGRSLTVWTGPETVEKLNWLLEALPKENKSSLIAKAIDALYEKTKGNVKSVALNRADDPLSG
jgi:hypothetical protein